VSNNQVDNMSFLEHLEELRWHILRSMFAIIVTGIACFIMKDFIVDTILFGPMDPSFPTYEFLCKAARSIGVETNFCGDKFNFTIISETLMGQFSAHFWSSIYAGFIISFPYVLYEFWRFISPGLLQNEKNNSKGFIFICSFLFFLGVLFGYYIIVPISLNFFGNYELYSGIDNLPKISDYLGFVTAPSIACGIMFELPIIIFFLTRIGVVTPKSLIKYRKYAILIVLIIAAIITPPDVFSQIIVAVPVMILYQISIFISRLVLKKQNK